MLRKALYPKLVRLLILTAVSTILIGSPIPPSVYAGDCATSSSDNCGG